VKDNVVFFGDSAWLEDVQDAVRSLAQDSQQEEAQAAAAAAGGDETSVQEASERSRKRARTSQDEALLVFREVMTEPRVRNLPSTVEEFFKHLALSEAQIQGLLSLLPASTHAPSFLLLFGLEEAQLVEAGLAGVQVRAWKNASSKLI
jgi:hypothetical protein